MTGARGKTLPCGRAGAVVAALLAAALAGCAVPVPLLEPGQAPMVTGQSPGTSFTDGSKEAPFSSESSYPPGAASKPAPAR